MLQVIMRRPKAKDRPSYEGSEVGFCFTDETRGNVPVPVPRRRDGTMDPR